MRSALRASLEVQPPGSLQLLVLVLVMLAAGVLTSAQVPDVDDLAVVLRRAVASPEAGRVASNISFAVPSPFPKKSPGRQPHSGPQVPLSSLGHQHPPPPTPH